MWIVWISVGFVAGAVTAVVVPAVFGVVQSLIADARKHLDG